MELRLQNPPRAEFMDQHASTAVRAAARVDGVVLDYSVGSLGLVDSILEGFHAEGFGPRQIGETIFSRGAHVGEVIVRNNEGAAWQDPQDSGWAYTGWPTVALGPDHRLNPIGKAFKRVESGDVESLTYFYDALLRRLS